MFPPAALAVPLSPAGPATAAASPTGQGRQSAGGPGGRATWQGHALAGTKHRAATSTVAAGLGEPASSAPCQSGTCQSVEERQRRQRLQSDMHQRAAAAAAAGRAYHAMLEQRERQRAAVAEEQERMRSMWASANTARPRHVPRPRPPGANAGNSSNGSGASRGSSTSRLGPQAGSQPMSSSCHAAATAAAPRTRIAPPSMRTVAPSSYSSSDSVGSQTGPGPQLRDARFWMLYTLQWNRLYEDANGDDLWGQGFSTAAAAGKQGASQATSKAGKASGFGTPADEYWRAFVRKSARGWRFHQAYGAGPQQAHQAQQQQQQQGPLLGELPTLGATAGGSSLEQEVRAELARMLTAAGGDLLRFIAALGVEFEPAVDRGAALRNARTAFLLRLHPDKLRQAGEREQLQGLLATQVFNSLWAAERGRA